MQAVNQEKLHEFVGQMVGDLSAAATLPLVRMGDTLGLYEALAEKGPADSRALAAATDCDERYLREWLSGQAAAGYVTYDAASGQFSLTPEQAMVFAAKDSPVNLIGAFDTVAAMYDNQEKVQAAFRTGKGVGWGNQAGCLFCAVARFFRPGYVHNLVGEWIPALDGVADKLRRGADVADVGCGHGISTILMAEAFPNSTFTGYDFHDGSIDAAREHAREHGVPNARFEVGLAKDFPARNLDLVTCFDCLHDMGDPRGAAEHIRSTLKSDGTWMIVEPLAGDTLTDNLNPVGRIYYAASTMICVPTSLDQEVGTALGAQAGEKRLTEVIAGGGFRSVRRAAEGPFNMVLEARP